MKPIDPAIAARHIESDCWIDKVAEGNGGCIIWTGAQNSDGYGNAWVAGAAYRAHRVAFVAAAGADVPAGLELDHLCRNRACVNPAHLEAVSHKENVLRGTAPTAQQSRMAHCAQGHRLSDPASLYAPDAARGKRQCAKCREVSERRRRFVVRAAQLRLGMSQSQYIARYGLSVKVAAALLSADETQSLDPAALKRLYDDLNLDWSRMTLAWAEGS